MPIHRLPAPAQLSQARVRTDWPSWSRCWLLPGDHQSFVPPRAHSWKMIDQLMGFGVLPTGDIWIQLITCCRNVIEYLCYVSVTAWIKSHTSPYLWVGFSRPSGSYSFWASSYLRRILTCGCEINVKRVPSLKKWDMNLFTLRWKFTSSEHDGLYRSLSFVGLKLRPLICTQCWGIVGKESHLRPETGFLNGDMLAKMGQQTRAMPCLASAPRDVSESLSKSQYCGSCSHLAVSRPSGSVPRIPQGHYGTDLDRHFDHPDQGFTCAIVENSLQMLKIHRLME